MIFRHTFNLIIPRTSTPFNTLRAGPWLSIQRNYRFTQARGYYSPLSKFMDTIREQVQKNKELQQNVKLLQDQAGQLGESDTLRRAKEVYTKAKV